MNRNNTNLFSRATPQDKREWTGGIDGFEDQESQSEEDEVRNNVWISLF